MFSSERIDKSKASLTRAAMFQGDVYRQVLGRSDELEMAAVFFENGARTVPHVHHTDQVLAVVEGTCVVADSEGLRRLGVGEVALVKHGEWHWHGADKGTNACHLSLRKSGSTEMNVEQRDWAAW
jgi:quercetin dioxygenase-like cupin family protein